jgi:hypothetical protein
MTKQDKKSDQKTDELADLWRYVFRLFPVFDIIFGIYCAFYSDNWLFTLCYLPVFFITAGSILYLSTKRNFEPGLYIFILNGVNFFVFASISGPNAPTWLLLINVCIGATFMFKNARIGQFISVLFTIITALFFYQMGASAEHCITFSGALLAFTILFTRTNDYLELQRNKIEAQKKLIEEKQQEITDSIHYARRIQTSLMPTEKYLRRVIGGGR